jgi:hypothetical protein
MAASTLRASPSLPHPDPLPPGGKGRRDPFGLPSRGVHSRLPALLKPSNLLVTFDVGSSVYTQLLTARELRARLGM